MQGVLFRPPPARACPPFTVIDHTGRAVRARHLTVAVSHAARAAAATGEAWLLAADGTACHIASPAGPAVPFAAPDATAGWPSVVTRILTQLHPESEPPDA